MVAAFAFSAILLALNMTSGVLRWPLAASLNGGWMTC